MNFLEVITRIVSSIELLGRLSAQLQTLAKSWPQLSGWLGGQLSYENLALDLVLEIQDPGGQRAVLERRQSVRLMTQDAELVRDLVWGDGRQLARYSARGARRLGVQAEGPRQAVLLVLPDHRSTKRHARLRMRRLIRGGFTDASEYFETMLERPTRRVSMRVLFPRSRPPAEAHLVTTPPDGSSTALPIRFATDGRAIVSWRLSNPQLFRTYSLRWSW